MTTPSTSKRIAALIVKIAKIQYAYYCEAGYCTEPEIKDQPPPNPSDAYAPSSSYGDDTVGHDGSNTTPTEDQDLDIREEIGSASDTEAYVSDNSSGLPDTFVEGSGDQLHHEHHDMPDEQSDDEFAYDSSSSDDGVEDTFSDCSGHDDADFLGPSLDDSYLFEIKSLYRELANSGEYDYEFLEPGPREIRILHIMPREFGAITGRNLVSCYTVVATPDDAPEYSAISYAWGDEKDTRPIMLNNRVVQVTANLAAFLRHAEHHRYRWGIRNAWIDALCINQKDDSEKSRQVEMMGDIYAGADEVIAWLGRPPRLTFPLFNWIKKMTEDLGREWEEAHPGRDFMEDMSDYRLLSHELLASLDTILWGKLIHSRSGRVRHLRLLMELSLLCNAPYWRRVWILQEIRHAAWTFYVFDAYIKCRRRNHFGECPLFQFGLTESVRARLQLMEIPSKTLYIALFPERSEGLSLLLRTTAVPYPPDTKIWQKNSTDSNEPFFLSTRPEDKVFALLSMARDSLDLGIMPDYTKCVQDVYVETARTIMQANQDLGLLYFCQPHNNRVEGLPSWVPDWSVCVGAPPINNMFQRPPGTTNLPWTFSACLETSCQITFLDDTTLMLSGVLVDVVDCTLRFQSDNNLLPGVSSEFFIIEKMQDFVVSALNFISQRLNKKGCGGPRGYISKVYRELAHGRICNLKMVSQLHGGIRKGPGGAEEYVLGTYNLCACEILRELIMIAEEEYAGTGKKKFDFTDLIALLSLRRSDPFDYMRESQIWLAFAAPFHRHRRIFSTTRGFIGLGPERVQKGDMVVIFHGGYVPFVLRPSRKKTGCYEIVGEAYMYGMMEGEFMWTNPKTREFTIV